MEEQDIQILKQLYHGHHLEPYEITRAWTLLKGMELNLKGRVL